MIYVPNNRSVYEAALSGTLGGLLGGRIPTTDPANIEMALLAGVFAQCYDTVWGTATATSLEVQCTMEVCGAAWEGRGPRAGGAGPTTFLALAGALIGIVQAVAAYVASLDIDSPIANDFLPVFNIANFGAKVNGRQLADSVVQGGSGSLHNASAPYSTADVGKPIFIQGAGGAGGSYYGVIAQYVSPTQVQIVPTAGTSVVNARTIYGTDDSVAVQNAINAASVRGGVVFHPPGLSICNTSITLPSLVRYLGVGDASQMAYIGGVGGHVWIAVNAEAADFSIQRMSFNYTGCDNVPTTVISVTDSVYFTLTSLYVQGSVQTNKCVGLYLHAVSPTMVPPPGFGRISNYVYSSGDGDFPLSFVAVGAYSVQIVAETGSQNWNFLVFDGYGDLEAASIAFSATRMYSSTITDGWYLSATTVGLQLIACQNNLVVHLHTANSTPQVSIDAACFDNVFVQPAFSNPTGWATAVSDAGVRSVWYGTGNYQVSSVPYPSSSTVGRPNPIPETVAAYMEWDTTLQAPIWGLGGTNSWYNTAALPLAGFFYGPITFSGGQVLVSPTSAGLVTLHVPQNILPTAAPPAPATGMTQYVDQADGKLKVIASTGTITPLASP